MIDFRKVLSENIGIVAYVTALSLLFFFISLLSKPMLYSMGYLVCALGSLVNLIPIEKTDGDVKRGFKKIFYVITFSIVSLVFLLN